MLQCSAGPPAATTTNLRSRGEDHGADRQEQRGREAADNVAAISSRTANGAADATREAAERTQDAARRGFEQVQRTAGAVFEVERAIVRRSTEGATEVGRAFAELVREQSRDNVAAFRSLTDTFWDQAARIQADLLRASLERSAEFTRRYLEVVQAVTASAVSATRSRPARRLTRRPSPPLRAAAMPF
jgi:hypothetical protein